ncbi:hypothetical protein [Streptomyces sp. NRRL F-5053]|uniref:hypothetical protein n=1 Tax=Streptomyces sp. NRRL F-5053 TaxID=1463854 RepID=UPI0013316F20|nr:hypothetical protein [Streptomyces sp. NRRL F-5053]
MVFENEKHNQDARAVQQRILLHTLQHCGRPLAKSELLPGLWVEMTAENEEQWVRSGLLARDQREPLRIVMWTMHTATQGRAHLILGPSEPRDASKPVHEIRPVDPRHIDAEQRKLLKNYASQSTYNQNTGEFDIIE